MTLHNAQQLANDESCFQSLHCGEHQSLYCSDSQAYGNYPSRLEPEQTPDLLAGASWFPSPPSSDVDTVFDWNSQGHGLSAFIWQTPFSDTLQPSLRECFWEDFKCTDSSSSLGSFDHASGEVPEVRSHGLPITSPALDETHPGLGIYAGIGAPFYAQEPQCVLLNGDGIPLYNDDYFLCLQSSVESQVVNPTLLGETTTSTAATTPEEITYKTPSRRILPSSKDANLMEGRRMGLTYKEIKERWRFTESESTLRGRFRVLTKKKEHRVRKPTWEANDIRLLHEAVEKLSARHRNQSHAERFAVISPALKVSWKRVAEYIWKHGSSYPFANSTCKKKWAELVGARNNKPRKAVS
ncbi:hypothetical protein KEM55_001954 [Ascosphaera atra]|nr:hypothetical protein KEM55_001954 [Ascosphaera atra]